MKLSDDEIEEVFTSSGQFVEFYFTPSAILWAFYGTNRCFKCHKRSQLFIHMHNDTPAVVPSKKE